MVHSRHRDMRLLAIALCLVALGISSSTARAQRRMEALDRGLVAVKTSDDSVFLSWRLLASDPAGVAFNVYRSTAAGQAVKCNVAPLTAETCFSDSGFDASQENSWSVRPVEGTAAGAPGHAASIAANSPARPYLAVPMKRIDGYSPNDCSVGDLDGDGQYEIVVHQAGRGRDNSQNGATSEPILQAYRLDGRLLWEINLGRNIREGAHYTQFLVYDLDGDGRAEMVCKTADGTVDGTGRVLGDPGADHRSADGRILTGPEFLSVFDGQTGEALATVDYVPGRGNVGDWGDAYGNRVDRFLGCVAYLDGERPSVIMCRGYYTRAVLAAWNWREGKLTPVWVFDSDSGPEENRAYRGQGDHCLSVADVDDDCKDEIIYGACTIDDDGSGLYSTLLGHGDALHVSDIDPDRPGLEVFNIHEHVRHQVGVGLRDARTGTVIWSRPSPDVGRGVALDIDPRHRGYEMWASGANLRGLWNARGEVISEAKPRSCNFGCWWDGDLLRELLDRNRISKWDWNAGHEHELLVADECTSNNGSKATPCLCADIIGDWREEVIWRTSDDRELRVYSTTIPSRHRLTTLMHDPQYRLSVAWQNVAYNQPTQPGFYLGDGMTAPKRRPIVVSSASDDETGSR